MRRTVGASVAVLALAVLVGCSGPGASSESSDSGGGAAPAVAPADPSASRPDRQIVTTATASVTVKPPAAGAQRVSELVEAAGGRVDQRTEQAASGGNGDQGAVADLVVRVPADALTKLLADLEDVGDVTNVSVSHSDVTAKTTDLDARISALQTPVTRLQGLRVRRPAPRTCWRPRRRSPSGRPTSSRCRRSGRCSPTRLSCRPSRSTCSRPASRRPVARTGSSRASVPGGGPWSRPSPRS